MTGRIDSARVAKYACIYCEDSGVQIGRAELDDEIVLISRPCPLCNVATERRKAFLLEKEKRNNNETS